MPQGRYTVLGDDGQPIGTETFRCAPGPAGWRYVSEIATDEHGAHRAAVDLTVDATWRIVRTHVRTEAGHDLLLEPGDGSLVGRRDGAAIEVPWSDDDHLDYLTPATNLVTCRRLDGSADLEVVFVDPFTLEPTRERQRYARIGDEHVETPVGAFEATRWTYTSLASGWTSDLWVAGDVVVRYERLFELTAYEPGATGVAPGP